MLKRFYSLLAIVSLLLGLSTVAFAHGGVDRTPRVNHRQQGQQKRIVHGVRSGELTRAEVFRLEREQRGILREKRQARADGAVTFGERRDIYREQNQASRHIYRAKHNRRDRH